jgi:uncharacterized membrane protein
MATLIAFITKTFLTEVFVKAVVVALGDHLVESSKNKLTKKLWNQVKKALDA